MTTSKDVFLSQLCMDAYNRGYGAGVADSAASDPDGLGKGSAIEAFVASRNLLPVRIH